MVLSRLLSLVLIAMAVLDPAVEKSFSFLQEACKQLLTLSTGVIALTVTFFKEFSGGPNETARALMPFSWGAFVVSILAGLACLFSLTGTITAQSPSIYTTPIRLSAGIQQVAFVIAIILAVIAGINALGGDKPSETSKTGASGVEATILAHVASSTRRSR